MLNVRRRKIILAGTLIPATGVIWAKQPDSNAVDCTRIEVGYSNENNTTSFMVPRLYNPQIHGGFFRIVLDYPSMTPTVTEPGSPAWKTALDIQVHGFPVNGTTADYIAAGKPTIKRAPDEGEYQVFFERINSHIETKCYLYRDELGNNVVLRKPPFDERDRLTHGFEKQFYFDCFISKGLSDRFRDIDSKVSKLLLGFNRNSNARCNQ